MKRLLTTTLAAGALGTLLVLAGPAAHADVVFTIGSDNNFSGAGNPTGPYGTVDLIDGTGTAAGQNGIPVGTVQVTVTLAPNVFANTGASDTLEFSLASGLPTLTTTDITNLNFTGPGATPSSFFTLDLTPTAPNNPGFGGFGIGLNCGNKSNGCGNGTSPPTYNSLTFDITDGAGLTSADFVKGDPNGYYFLADLGIPKAGGGFSTGYSGATLTCTNCVPTLFNSAPEPASLALLGVGLLGTVAFARRRRA